MRTENYTLIHTKTSQQDDNGKLLCRIREVVNTYHALEAKGIKTVKVSCSFMYEATLYIYFKLFWLCGYEGL